ncbi:phosphate ABC transporter permease PstA [Methylibium sp.]|uniref:phosphate ABC transporter permease PstA n=1 Tax=Methylibium sp. TaxID=2067992 RepID=UPI003D139EEF
MLSSKCGFATLLDPRGGRAGRGPALGALSKSTSPLPRRWRDAVFAAVVCGATGVVVLALGWILWDVVRQGATQLSWDYLWSEPRQSGRAGGIAPILVSTLAVLLVALLSAVPLGVGAAVWLVEFGSRHRGTQASVRLALDALAGVPSIVFGLFGSAFFSVFLGLGFSVLSGGLTLACMILPIVIRTSEAGLSALPTDWRPSAAALGLTRTSALRHLLLPAAAPAIMAGVMLGIGRATAETAALIFTSGYVDRMPDSLLDSGRTLAVHIYDLAMNVAGGDRAAYASACVLVLLIVSINVLSSALAQGWMARKISPS